MFCRHLGNSETKKPLKFHLEFNFNNFQERKNGKVFKLIAVEIDIIGIDILGFDVNMIVL